VFCDFPCYVEM
jgi:aryl carrier-like protein